MRKVTVSRMRERYAQKVLTFRITYVEYQNKHYSINQKDEGTQDDQGRDGGTKFILRIKEQDTRLKLHEHDDDNDDVS